MRCKTLQSDLKLRVARVLDLTRRVRPVSPVQSPISIPFHSQSLLLHVPTRWLTERPALRPRPGELNQRPLIAQTSVLPNAPPRHLERECRGRDTPREEK